MSPFRAGAPLTDDWAHFRFEVVDRVATITLDRPDKLNALTFEVYADLRDLLVELPHRADVESGATTGDGRGLCRGGDVAPTTSTRSSAGCWRWTPGTSSSSPG